MSEKQENITFGPITKERYDPAFWKNIKDKLYHLNNTNEEETIPDCTNFLQFLLEFNASPSLTDFVPDQTARNYFLNEFLILNAKNLIATKTFNNPDLLYLSNRCLEEMVILWAKLLNEDHPKLTETAKIILDPARSYFKMNNQEDLPTSVVPSFFDPPSEDHLKWILSLKENDLVDCIKIDTQYKKLCWSHGRVAFIMESHIKVAFVGDKDSSIRYIEKQLNAHEIAPYKTRCLDSDWRNSLQAGDELDACDTTSVWYNATVLDSRENGEGDKAYKEIKIGYRVFREHGDKQDAEGRKFVGWSARYDEWLTVTNPRLAKFNTMAKKLYMGSSSNNDDPVIDDSNDVVYRNAEKPVYAVTRNPHCKSIWMVKLVNRLGEMGFFDRILDRINDPNNWAPIETVSIIVTALGNLSAIFHRDFCYDYIPKLKDAVWKNILKSPDANLRNFNKERIENIIQAFDSLLKRVVSIPEKNEALEMLQLEICSMCFDTDFLERKLQGLKILLDIIRNLKLNTTKFITPTQLNKFLESHKILEKIYGQKGHVQLIQRSADFLKYMTNESSIEIADLELVWNAAIKGVMETKLSILKILSEIALSFKTEHLEFFIKKISDIPSSELIADEIELVYELSRFSLKSSGFSKRVRDFYWTIISDQKNEFSVELVELTLNKFCDLMRTWELKEERLDVLYGCMDNLQKDVSSLASLKILKKIIDHYPAAAATTDKFTKATCIEHLCKEKDLLNVLITDLKSFKANLKKRLPEGKEINEALLDSLVGERATFTTHINERLQFIHFTLANADSSEITLTYDYLSQIWDSVVKHSFVPAERDVVYKWIKETAESRGGFPMSIEDLLKFFQEKMNDAQDFQNMTIEGFNCFKNVFLVINEKQHNISKINTVVNHGTQNSGIGVQYISYSYNSEETRAASDFDYKIMVEPFKLEGIQSIWNFILSSENEAVVEKAIDFLNKLYISLDVELESQIVSIRQEFLTTCITKLREVLESRTKLSETAFSNSCVRCLSLIRSLLDETEKRGVGNLKSHSGLVKGEILTFTVVNDITSGVDVPKKAELRLPSNLTVFELRCEIGKQFKATWDQVKILRGLSQKEVKDNENGKTIGDIRIRNGETLNAAKRPTPPIPQATLVYSDGALNPGAKRIFIDWYNTFSTNGLMGPDGCAAFIHSCTNDHCKGDDKRVKEVFLQYDKDKDGFLKVEDFIEFYYQAARARPHVVWNNISAHHYRNDLKKVTEVEAEKVDTNTLARFILCTNEEYFKLIFSLLDFGGKVSIDAWKLLNSLPTSPQIFADIVTLKGIRDDKDKKWDLILDSKSSYKLLYALTAIEYLMEDEGDEEQYTSHHLWSGQPELLEYKKTWRADFIVYGGFDHLFKIFNRYAQNKQNTLTIFDKNILSFILKILKNYLTATFASSVPHLYRYISFVRLFHLSLDFINDYLSGDVAKALAQEDNSANQGDVPATNPKFKKSPSVAENDELAASLNREDSIGPVNNPQLKKTESKVEKAEEKKKEKYKIEETEEFKTLVERLKGDLGSHVIKTINLREFIGLITRLGFEILNISGELESEDRMILEFSLCILVAILLYDKQNILYFINPENKPDWLQGADNYILEGIFCSKSINIRRYFSHALYILSKDTQNFGNGVLSKYLISLFLKNLPSSQDESKKDCIQYFELLCKLIEESYAANPEASDALPFDTLIGQVVERIKNHQSTERRNNLHLNDKIFMGLVQLCEKILNCKPSLRETVGDPAKHNLVEYLFTTCLFDITDRDTITYQDMIDDQDANVTSKDYVKAKSKDSRNATYKLILTLCRDNPANTSILLKNLTSLMSLITKVTNTTSWGYSPAGDTKSFYGYLGIKNLGCICYMIAMLQQFFMTPAFRYGILMSDDKQEPNIVKKDKWTIDDNVVHQLQQMFGFLELSDRQDYNPYEFCFSFKDFSGQPVNVSVQQDTQEFLNMIFDKLENGLKQTPFKSITDSVYGGRTCGQIVCNGCGAIKEKVDPFYNLSVEVRNMKTLYDSLDKTIAGEIIEGYFCESCKKQQEITKRTCLEALPNVLIVHLQRIVFDLDTLMNQKINSRLEFPIDLNVEPYTKEGLEWRERAKNKSKKAKAAENGADGDTKGDEKGEEEVGERQESDKPAQEEAPGPYKLHPKEYYEYKLAGVVVHVGTADFGHYYSYINTNRGDPSKRDKSKPDKWLEYNDSNIRDFDVKNLESECFGGANTEGGDDAWSWVKVGRENSKNAYILVYEKVVKDPLKLTVTNPDDESYLNKIFKGQDVKIVEETTGEGENQKVQKNYSVNYYDLKRFVPARVYKKVWEDNHKFMFERHVYNEDFPKFIKEVCNSLKLPAHPADCKSIINPEHLNLSPEQKQNIGHLIKALTMQIFYLLARAHDNNCINDLALNLRNLIALAPECAWEFFETVALKDMKNSLDLMLSCPDKSVRYYTSQLILFSINVMIAHYELTLNIPKLKEREQNMASLTEEERHKHNVEDNVIKFLNLLIYLMPNDVAKNWLRFTQYFEFWRDFAFNGDAQVGFLYQKSFIAVLIDFFLEKRSPVPELSEKKHSMGNRYTEPDFNPLLQLVNLLVCRSQVITQSGNIPFTSLARQGMSTWPLSENDLRCLYCPDFYDKATKEKYDASSIGTIIQHFAFENESFSEMIAQILLRGLNRSNFEEAKTYLDTMAYYISIFDNLQGKRVEWLMGYPQIIPHPTRTGNDNFGIYGNTDFEDLVVSYDSPLFMDQCQSVINLMLHNRKRLENLCLVLLKQVLLIMDNNQNFFDYIISLPPPSYNYAKFTDWMAPFIEYYLVEAKRYSYTVFQKEEMGQETMKIFRSVEDKVNKRIELIEKMQQQLNDSNSIPDQDPTVLKYVYNKPYIIGQTVKEEAINTEAFSDPSEPFRIHFTSSEIVCYTTDSRPTGNGNLSFPNDFQNDNRILSSEIKPGSPYSYFIIPGKPDTENRAVIVSDVEAAMKANKIGVSDDRDEIHPILDEDDGVDVDPYGPVDAPMQDGSDTEIDSKGSNHEDAAVETENKDNQVQAQQPPKDKEESKEATVEITTEKIEKAPEQAFDFKYDSKSVIRRFIIFNESPYHLDVSLTFSLKQGSFVNFRIPYNNIRQIVKPKSNYCLFSIVKSVADRDWGDYEVKCNIRRLENVAGPKPGEDSGKKRNMFQIRQIDTTTRVDGVPDDRVHDELFD